MKKYLLPATLLCLFIFPFYSSSHDSCVNRNGFSLSVATVPLTTHKECLSREEYVTFPATASFFTFPTIAGFTVMATGKIALKALVVSALLKISRSKGLLWALVATIPLEALYAIGGSIVDQLAVSAAALFPRRSSECMSVSTISMNGFVYEISIVDESGLESFWGGVSQICVPVNATFSIAQVNLVTQDREPLGSYKVLGAGVGDEELFQKLLALPVGETYGSITRMS